MPTEQEKQEIRRLAKNGKSVNHIRDQLGLPKSTVYYHFRKEVGQKQKRNALQTPKNPETIGEITGIFAGDGGFYKDKNRHYNIRFTLNYSEEYWKVLRTYLTQVLDKSPHESIQEEDSRVRLMYSSKDLYQFFKAYLHWEKDKTKTVCLHENKHYSDEFLIGFLRGLIDTDGHMSPRCRRYVFSTISQDLATNTKSTLEHLGLNSKLTKYEYKQENWRPSYLVAVSRREAEKFANLIQPRNPKKQPKAHKWTESTLI